MKKLCCFVGLLITFQTATLAQEEEIIEIIEVEAEEEMIELPFAILEEVPIFPGCESDTITDKRQCFQEKIYEHISANFRYPEDAQKEKMEGLVLIRFNINENGEISNIETKGPHEILKNEGQRIVSLLPTMLEPGMQRGKSVTTIYNLPLTFKLK